MQYRLLGHSGLRVSEFALGTMTFGEDYGWGTAKDESRRIFDAFREAGGNFLDTANIYTGGTSETFLGEFIAGQRQNVVLATKYSNSNPATDPNAAGNHRKCMVQTLEASLRRLRTDYIDLFWMHVWDQLTPVEEVMRGLDDLIRQGKVLYVGASNAPAWWIAQANTIAALRGWSPFVGLQIEYSLIERTAERELLADVPRFGAGSDGLVAPGRRRSERQIPNRGREPVALYQRDHAAIHARAANGRARGCRAANRGRPNWPVPGPSRAGLAALPSAAHHPHRGRPEALAIAGQPGQS